MSPKEQVAAAIMPVFCKDELLLSEDELPSSRESSTGKPVITTDQECMVAPSYDSLAPQQAWQQIALKQYPP